MTTLRPWAPGDRAGCLATFDSNVPRYFSAVERSDFDAYLERMPGPYLVLVDDREVVGCGGWAASQAAPRVANLCWGMIHSRAHRRGLGRLLLRARLADIRAHGGIDAVELSTSQHTPRFFEREGFGVIRTRENAFAPGLHAVDMRLDVRPIAAGAVLFDLDGTLTDAFEGIARSIEHALEALGRPAPSASALRRFVGPPIRESFVELLGVTGPVDDATRIYRERYGREGLFENRIYAGVPDMLAALKRAGCTVRLCTAKRRDFAERILRRFEIDTFFDGVHGSENDGRFERKADLVRHIIDTYGLSPPRAVLVGDREHDVRAAAAHGITAIGVTYGYGSKEELLGAGAHALCASPCEVAELLLRG